MIIQQVMSASFPTIDKEATRSIIAQRMIEANKNYIFVTENDNTLLGIITDYDFRVLAATPSGTKHFTAEKIMTPWPKLQCTSPDTDLADLVSIFSAFDYDQIPVCIERKVVGVVYRREALETWYNTKIQLTKSERWDDKATLIIESMSEGLIVLDKDMVVREVNPAAERMLGLRAKDRIGRRGEQASEGKSPVDEVLQTGQAQFEVETPMMDGRIFMVNYVPMLENGNITGVIQTFRDITAQKSTQQELITTREELDKAFALTLPNSKVEKKLKTTPEYRDIYNPATGLIQITEIIPDGGYLHVVNALKVAADLNEQGVLNLVGVNKDALVQAITFHDIGKSQPVLRIGDVVDPKEVFEDSKLHAERSAEIASHFYHKEDDVVTLIRYHHHEEHELPASFPKYLLPMYRLLRLVDGLSAGITRRRAKIKIQANGTKITVEERNGHPSFHRTRMIDIFTGEVITVTGEAPNLAGGHK